MIHYVYASPGVPEQVQQVFPGQPKRNEYGIEWGELLHRKLAAYWHHILFIKDLKDKGELIIGCFTMHLILADHFKCFFIENFSITLET